MNSKLVVRLMKIGPMDSLKTLTAYLDNIFFQSSVYLSLYCMLYPGSRYKVLISIPQVVFIAI